MKTLIIVAACFAFMAEARVAGNFGDLNPALSDYSTLEDHSGGGCLYDCNSGTDSRNQCIEGRCACAQGFKGRYCTCEGLCDAPFGTCYNDVAGTCNCTTDWKGRNCNCPVTCPDSPNWRCKTGDTVEERGCICKVDGEPWYPSKNCCPKQCSGLMNCLKDDGVCYCPTTNSKIPYGSSPDQYKCCPAYCKDSKVGGLCECRTDGCFVKLSGQRATKESDCVQPLPGSCKTHDSWQECSIVHWQGKCQCDPILGCRCKCWYGWAGGQGNYGLPGWDAGYKALYSDHCRNRCDWTHEYQPTYCSSCNEVACPECSPTGARKCQGTF